MKSTHDSFMKLALRLAARGRGTTTPNPMVGAVLVRQGKVIGQGFHLRAGGPHAEIEALRDAAIRGESTRGATLYVTLEPCCTQGRTPPCTEAIIAARIRRVVVAATDPNPHHAGHGFDVLRGAGITVETGIGAQLATRLNSAFNHWICHRTPWVTLKVAQTLDGKIATAAGASKWITGEGARRAGQRLRHNHDGILVGVETILHDDPALTIRRSQKTLCHRRFVLDTRARTPLTAQVVNDRFAAHTTVVVGDRAAARRVSALAGRVSVWVSPLKHGRIDLDWLMSRLGAPTEGTPVTSLLVEGGGEVHASFLHARLAHRFVSFLAPKILGGRNSRRAVGGDGFNSLAECPCLVETETRHLPPDLQFSGLIKYPSP